MKYKSQQERMAEIYNVIKDSTYPLTRREICEALNLKKSPHITKYLNFFVDKGIFIQDADTMPNGATVFTYFFNPEYNKIYSENNQ